MGGLSAELLLLRGSIQKQHGDEIQNTLRAWQRWKGRKRAGNWLCSLAFFCGGVATCMWSPANAWWGLGASGLGVLLSVFNSFPLGKAQRNILRLDTLIDQSK